MTTALGSRFDVASYVRDPIALRPDDVDLRGAAALGSGGLAVVEHLWAVERGILDLLRDLLLTPTHAEARVTAFLNTWAYEQYWLAQSLAAVIEANGGVVAEPPDSPLGAVHRFWDERIGPTVIAVRTNLLGEDVVAAHMVTGWLDTAVLDLGYRRLVEIEPGLARLGAAVGPLKERHLAFYADDARARLTRSAGGRDLARRAVQRWDWPEVRYAGRRAVRGVVERLYADRSTAARVRGVDAAVASFPGLAGVTPLRCALGRLAPPRWISPARGRPGR